MNWLGDICKAEANLITGFIEEKTLFVFRNKMLFLWYLRDGDCNLSFAVVGPNTVFTEKIITMVVMNG